MSGDMNKLENFLSATQVELRTKSGAAANTDALNVNSKAVGIGTGTQLLYN